MRSCPKCGLTYADDVQYCPTDGSALGPELGGAEAADPRVGTLIDRYRVLEKLGEGGMGMVYKAEHTLIGRPVAMKLLHPDLARIPQAVDRFFREARAANEVPSEHIVEVTDFGKASDGSNFLVMEYLTGISLHGLLEREKRLAPARAARISSQIAEGLAAAHERGVVHRDLKPANVQLVQRDADPEYVKLLDFGIAKITESGTQLTKTGMILGSPAYMSPEQASGKPVDHRTDIYALGVILHELLVGSPPFTGEGPTQILLAHVMKEPPPLRSMDPGVPELLEQLVLQCLAKDPAQRPQGMIEIMQRLNSWLAAGQAGAGASAAASAAAVAPTAIAATLLPATPGPTGPFAPPAQTGAQIAPPATTVPPAPAGVTGPGLSAAPMVAGTGGPITTGLGAQTMPVQPPTAEGSNRGLLIGLAIGGGLLLVGIATAAVLLLGGKPTDEVKPKPEEPKTAAVVKPDAAPTKLSAPDAARVATADPDAAPTTEAVAKPDRPGTGRRRPARGETPEPRPGPQPKPEPRPEPRPTPKVTIASVPSGAGIYSQGRMIGRAPLAFPSSGTFGVTLRMQGYQDQLLNVPTGARGTVTARLIPVPEYRRTISLGRVKDLYKAGQMSRPQYKQRLAELKQRRDGELDQIKMWYKQGRISKPDRNARIDAIKSRYR